MVFKKSTCVLIALSVCLYTISTVCVIVLHYNSSDRNDELTKYSRNKRKDGVAGEDTPGGGGVTITMDSVNTSTLEQTSVITTSKTLPATSSSKPTTTSTPTTQPSSSAAQSPTSPTGSATNAKTTSTAVTTNPTTATTTPVSASSTASIASAQSTPSSSALTNTLTTIVTSPASSPTPDTSTLSLTPATQSSSPSTITSSPGTTTTTLPTVDLLPPGGTETPGENPTTTTEWDTVGTGTTDEETVTGSTHGNIIGGVSYMVTRYPTKELLGENCTQPEVCPQGYTCNQLLLRCLHSCENKHCQNNGECHIEIDSAGLASPVCRCKEYDDYVYSGDNCEVASNSRERERAITLGVLIPVSVILLIVVIGLCVKIRKSSDPFHSFRKNYNVQEL